METLYTAEFETPIGPLRIATSERGLAYVELPHASGRGFLGWKERYAEEADAVEGFEPNRIAAAQLLEFLEGKRRAFDIALDLRGTDFQHAVWSAVLEVPYGGSATYRDIAEQIERPKAVRAVGAANGANPIPLIVPCHRIIGSSGKLQGYAGGLETKARLLAMERSRSVEGRLF